MTAKRSTSPAAKSSPKKGKAPARSRKSAHSAQSRTAKQRTVGPETTKHAQVLSLLRTPEGVTVPELAQALGWQAHSVRGFLSGTVVKKLKLTLQKHRAEGQPTRYSIAG